MDRSHIDTVKEFIRQAPTLPSPAVSVFAGIGALYLGAKLLSYLRLLLSSFFFSGTNVCHFGPVAQGVLNLPR